MKLRLQGPKAKTDGIGRLQILYHGTWGTVCNEGWNIKNANVACRQLGFAGAKSALNYNVRHGTGKIWMSDVSCTGNEMMLASCVYNGWGNTTCNHYQDVGLHCQFHSGNYVN